MNGITLSALGMLAVSIGAMVWGWMYRSDHALEGVGAIFGATTTAYAASGWALGLGVLGFLIGLGLLIAGLVKGSRRPPQ